MALDFKAVFRLQLSYQCGQEDDWRALQFRVLLDLCRYFASVRLRHDYIKQDHVRSKLLRGLMGFGRVIFWQDKIVTPTLQEDFNQSSRVTVVVNNQDTASSIEGRPAE